ncbi:MAG: tRNA (guanosine(37)-N1)-methyltransferase TrmD [Firmicutes bacterium]|nr:tRNA (guanosine(37)-N1)-methyltransferase TrmD [Bacillota bacterium]MBR3052622.1 tRNA (guanosine(37)-N1)-methyltransferase TrmD [Bacillota bacterium]
MKINILTIFPEMFAPLTSSMLGRAAESGILDFNIVDIRQFAKDKHHKTDDYTFGGGQGLVFLAEPAFEAMRSVGGDRTRNIYLSPRGKILDGGFAAELAAEEEITLFCGHYEGIDQRIIDRWNMEEVSIGDYIMTGGELAAMVLIDVFARLIPGVLPKEESAMDESVYSGLLEYPHYTKPRSFEGMEVPEVLISGDHKKIRLWRFEEALKLTKERRPDLFEKFVKNHGELSKDELKVLEKITE